MRKTKNRWPVDIGIHPLGMWPVRVILTNSAGGSFTTDSEFHEIEITIGINDNLEDVIDTAMHEALEGHMAMTGCSFLRQPMETDDPGAFMFILPHSKFYQTCHAATRFYLSINKDLLEIWKKRIEPLMKD